MSYSQGSIPGLGGGGFSSLSAFSETGSAFGFLSDGSSVNRSGESMKADLLEISELFSPMSK
jgi:hypothetical protein